MCCGIRIGLQISDFRLQIFQGRPRIGAKSELIRLKTQVGLRRSDRGVEHVQKLELFLRRQESRFERIAGQFP
jgi:hypothetical protein